MSGKSVQVKRRSLWRWGAYIVLAAFASFCAGVYLADVSAPLRGRLVARYEIAYGRYELLFYGEPPLGRTAYAQALRSRYGVESRVVGYCTVSRSLRAYVDAHDETVSREVHRKFGHDVFRECWDDALKLTAGQQGVKESSATKPVAR